MRRFGGPMTDRDFGELAAHYLEYADRVVGAEPIRFAYLLSSIAASLVYANSREDQVQDAGVDAAIDDITRLERKAYDRGWDAGQDEVVTTREALFRLLPRVESLEVRADLAEALGVGLRLSPEEPDPGRDWAKVEAHLFKPSGKWAYQVWLDYTGERHRGVSGEGPHGWHFDGHEMARRALARATSNGTSGVTFSELGSYWHLFVPHPPQGFPHWVQPVGPTAQGV